MQALQDHRLIFIHSKMVRLSTYHCVSSTEVLMHSFGSGACAVTVIYRLYPGTLEALVDSLASELGPPEQQKAVRMRLHSSGITIEDLTSKVYTVDELRERSNIQPGAAYLLHWAATCTEGAPPDPNRKPERPSRYKCVL